MENTLDQTLQEKINASTLPVVVDFWAPWCAPCKMMKPALEKVSAEFEGQVQVFQVNTDEDTQFAQSLNIRSIPTLVGFNQGKEIARRVGGISANDIRTFFVAVQKGEAFTSIDSRNRILRLFTAAVLLVMAFINGFNWIVLALSLGMFFFAVYDKCPVYNRVKAWLKERKQAN